MKNKLSGGTRAFQVFGILLYGAFLVFLILSLITSKAVMRTLAREHVREVEINEVYYERLTKNGFSKEESKAFFNGDGLRDVMALVMTEEVNAIFKDTEAFSYTKEDAVADVLKALQSINKDADPDLATYVMDVTGMSGLYIYDTPTQYKEAVLSVDNESNATDVTILRVIALLSSPVFPISVLVMYLTCTVILFLVCNIKEKRWLLLMDTALYPSLLCEAYFIVMTFGEREKDIIHKGIYLVGNMVGITSIVLSVITGIVIKRLTERGNEDE